MQASKLSPTLTPRNTLVSRATPATPSPRNAHVPKSAPTPCLSNTTKCEPNPTPISVLTPPIASTPSSTCSTEQNSDSDKETSMIKWECQIMDRKGFELMQIHANINQEYARFLSNKMVLIGYTKRSQLIKGEIQNTVRVVPKGKKLGIQQVAQMKLVGIFEGENDQYDFALIFDQPKLFVQLAFIRKGFANMLKQKKMLLM
eukprot:TRINITY_DN2418_c2_g1_i1.p4 TRINITY_DN2418_c2_g1~~TRINITY_DN2418_c2_g1_i1.p4  ORF type:complete len:225 (+),score=28.85 TRINITY_DN2418_c2_g1_i1:70-675(+)